MSSDWWLAETTKWPSQSREEEGGQQPTRGARRKGFNEVMIDGARWMWMGVGGGWWWLVWLVGVSCGWKMWTHCRLKLCDGPGRFGLLVRVGVHSGGARGQKKLKGQRKKKGQRFDRANRNSNQQNKTKTKGKDKIRPSSQSITSRDNHADGR